MKRQGLVESRVFGRTADGTEVKAHRLVADGSGLRVVLLDFGATLAVLEVPDAMGVHADVVLGFDGLADYEGPANQSFGGIPGRVANRIANARFELAGTRYLLEANDGAHHLHGGSRGLDRRVWQSSLLPGSVPGVEFRYESPDGEGGYPGSVSVRARYCLPQPHCLRIDLGAEADRDTPINLTSHGYYHLGGAGSGSVLDHRLRVEADRFTEVDDELIPTGVLAPVDGTPLDFRREEALGARIGALEAGPARGYDHNHVLTSAAGTLREVAWLRDPVSGRALAVATTQPGLQLYTANALAGQRGKGAAVYPARSAVCLEPQHFPDAVHHPHFPSVIVGPGRPYRETIELRFSALSPDSAADPAPDPSSPQRDSST